MKRQIIAALAVLSFAGPALASPEIDADTKAKVEQKLTAEGYEVRRVDSEDGMIEVYALKDGARRELYLESDLTIVKTKGED